MNINTTKKRTILVYMAALILLIGGIYLSYSLQDWQWFSRTGALIVVLGIYLTSSQLIENSRRLRQSYRGAQRGGNFERDWAHGKHDGIIRQSRTHVEDSLVLGKCGFNLLIIGTLIWGFGDLVALIKFL
jgi:lysylphosphatidylglycerol synthetase-like protein (DUF2156 family)